MLKKYGAIALLCAAAYGKPLQAELGQLVARQRSGSFYPITGASGGAHPRLEIRDLEKTGEMWNLYLLALTEFQAMDQNIIDSYYQIAGIHGMPWIPWDGVDVPDRPQTGYCPHNNILFSTWHRPYLMLFEQKLQKIAKVIADKFPSATKAKYQDAAIKLRIPFWDWAAAIAPNQPVYPTAVSNEKVKVTFPNGTVATIDNPLFNYDFHPLDNRQFNGTGCAGEETEAICQTSTRTIRPPTTELNTNFRNILESLRSSLMNVIANAENFNTISANSDGCGNRRWGNLESVHGNVHTLHFPGHMAPAGATAFDPMFWLHHANVDRQVAMWQTLHPESYLTECMVFTETWTIRLFDTLNETSPLTPFHKNTAGDFITSADVRYVGKLGYTYPDLVNTSQKQMAARFNKLYTGPADVPVTGAKSEAISRLKTSSTYTKYLARVQVPLYGLDDGNDGSMAYNVLVFIGDVSLDPKSWASSPNLVGMAATLGGAKMKNDIVTPYMLDLTDGLNKAIAQGSTSVEKAADYLKENLHYRAEIGGREIANEKLGKLKVELVSTSVQASNSESEFDKSVGDLKEHGSIDG